MCGLNGILRLSKSESPPDLDEVKAARDVMASRGPDGEGLWISPQRDLALGHRRLAIIDLSESGLQPMTSADGRYSIVFNGEIYNYRELRGELEARGARLRSQSDTEVLLELFAREDVCVFRRLRGMYAFAIWDEEEKRLLLARDPHGIKPLYYSENGHHLRFASQVRALRVSPAVQAEPDPAGVVGFLHWGSVPEPRTWLKGVRCLEAGHVLEVRHGNVRPPRAYEAWSPQLPVSGDAVSAAIEDSVRAHLVSDVPVGVFLSSGLDSSVIAALAKRNLPQPPLTFTVTFEAFEGTPLDEGPGAREVARALGLPHIEKRVGRPQLEGLWTGSLHALDQPSIDGFNVYVVSHFAHEAGVRVILSGLGGDEIFGSYPSFRQVPALASWTPLLRAIPGLQTVWPAACRVLAPDRPKLAGLLRFGVGLAGAYYLRRGLFLPDELADVIGPDMASQGLSAYNPIEDVAHHVEEPPPRDAWSAVHFMESGQYLRNQLLRDADWASMAHSLELRVPFVDHHLTATLGAARFEPAKTHGKAKLMQRCWKEVPSRLLARPKSGFTIPVPTTDGRNRTLGLAARATALEVLRHFGLAGLQC